VSTNPATLAAPEIIPPHQKQIVHIFLLAPGRLLPVQEQLPVAHAFERFPRPPCLLQNFPLLVARQLQAHQLLLQLSSVAQNLSVAKQSEAQLGGLLSIS
jgi:hypothetical protein